jgi:ABC-type spermidine/putrescine transport system permease subunit I
MNINCVIQNSFIVGIICSIIGVLTAYIIEIKNLTLKKILKIFLVTFMIGLFIHILLEVFDFNQICYNKKCYSLICRN